MAVNLANKPKIDIMNFPARPALPPAAPLPAPEREEGLALEAVDRSQAVPAAVVTENILLTGNIEHVITYINQDILRVQDQMDAYLQVLSQILALGGQYSGKCESMLKNTLFNFAKANPLEAQTTIQKPEFKNDDRLSATITKVSYLTVGILGYHNSTCNYTRRFLHHLTQTYCDNKHFGGNYTVLGATLVTGGLINSLTTDPNDPSQKKQREGWAAIAAGGIAMLVYPLIHTIYATKQDEP